MKQKFAIFKKAANKRARWIFMACALIPAFLLFILFNIIPTIKTFVDSLFNLNNEGINMFVGFENYIAMCKDVIFWKSLGNTMFLFVMSTAVTLLFALFFAYVLSKTKLRGKKFFRFVLYLPNILSIVVIAAIFTELFSPTGIINALLAAMGAEGPAWLTDDDLVLWTLLFIMVWQATGYYMIIYVAGMDNIDPCVYESASLDGAEGATKFFYITVPMIWNVIRVTLSLYSIGSINLSFQLVNAIGIAERGSAGTGNVLLNYMDQMYRHGSYGYSMAIGSFMFLVTFILSFIVERLTNKDVTD